MKNDFKNAINSFQDSIRMSANPLKNINLINPNLSNFSNPIPPIPSSMKKIDQLCQLNEKANETNAKIQELLSSEQKEIESLKGELKQQKDSHKHDWANSLISSIIGAAIGVVLTVLAAKNGLL